MNIKALSLFLIVMLSIGCAAKKPGEIGRTVWGISATKDGLGRVSQGAISAATKEVFLADPGNLYRVVDSKPQLVAKAPQKEARVQLAPGGEFYAWLIPQKEWEGLSIVRIMRLPDKQEAELRLADPPYGIGALILGYQGNLIVGVTPLDDWEGVHGRFQYTFWNQKGILLKKVILPNPTIWRIDPLGRALILLTEEKAIAYSSEGNILWEQPGQFRKASIAAGGKIALLNPAKHEDIDKVLVITGQSSPTIVPVPTPVHHLSLTPDGTQAAVGGDKGRYFYLDIESKNLIEGAKLPLKEDLFISDITFVTKEALALGLQRRTGEPLTATWSRGSVIIVSRDGHIVFRKDMVLRRPLAKFPSIITTFDTGLFIGATEDETVFIDLKQQPPLPR